MLYPYIKKYKYTHYLCLLIFITSCVTKPDQEFDENLIKVIDKKVDFINKDTSLITIISKTESGNNVGFYFKNDSLCQIIESGQPSFGSAFTNKFYFLKNQLIFVYKWSEISINGELSETKNNYYLNNNNIIKTDDSNLNSKKSSETLISKAIQLIKLMQKK